MKEGIIKKLFTDRKFGFINEIDNDKDLFFNQDNLNNHNFSDLKEGIAVKFEVTENEKGLSATNIEIVITNQE